MNNLATFLSGALRRVLAGLLAVLVVISAAETLAWAVFEISWAASTEVQGLLLATFGLLATAYGVQRGFHLGVDVVVRRLPAAWRVGVARGVAAWTAVLGGLLAFYGAALVRQVSNTLPATGWPAAWGYVPAVLGGVAMAFFAVHRVRFPDPAAVEASDEGLPAAVVSDAEDSR